MSDVGLDELHAHRQSSRINLAEFQFKASKQIPRNIAIEKNKSDNLMSSPFLFTSTHSKKFQEINHIIITCSNPLQLDITTYKEPIVTRQFG